MGLILRKGKTFTAHNAENKISISAPQLGSEADFSTKPVGRNSKAYSALVALKRRNGAKAP
jgi:hypothetical protein